MSAPLKRGDWVTCKGKFDGVLGVVTKGSARFGWANVRWVQKTGDRWWYAKRMPFGALRRLRIGPRSVLGSADGRAKGAVFVADAGPVYRITREAAHSPFAVTHAGSGYALGRFYSIDEAREAIEQAGAQPEDPCDIDALYAWAKRLRGNAP